MKKILTIFIITASMASCNNEKTIPGKFEVTGEIKNIEDQEVYLEQLYFSQKPPETLDTAMIKNGKFVLSAIAPDEGLFRIRTTKTEAGFLFINDKSSISFKADMKEIGIKGPDFNTPANTLLKNLLINIDDRRKALNETDSTTADTSQAQTLAKREVMVSEYKKFIVNFIDTISDPVVAMFAVGFTRDVDPGSLSKAIPNLTKRFPNHAGVADIVKQYNDFITKSQEPKQPVNTGRPTIGSIAPDFTMNDVDGKPFSLSNLKGKYVLVDFWASWCGPCRGENPNVVAAYEKFKDKNFTILGVSLDEDKAKWLKAINDDGLNWKQISDLKFWGSAAVPLYGFDGIPYNVLVDPQGKIIATELRGAGLEAKLSEVLQ